MSKWHRLFNEREHETIKRCREYQKQNPRGNYLHGMIIAKLSLLVDDLEGATEGDLELNGSIDAFIDSWQGC